MMRRLWKAAAASTLLLGAFAACSGLPGQSRNAATSLASDNIVVDAAGSRLYTANGDTNTVSVVDVKKRRTVGEIAVGREPQQLALSPNGKKLYVASKYTNSLEVVDVKKLAVAASVPTGIEPYGVVASGDGKRIYVANDRSSTVSVVDAATLKTVQTIPVDERPHTLALTADGGKLYVTHFLSGKVSVIDTTTYKVAKSIALAASPDKDDRKKSQGIPNTLQQIRIAPDGATAWVPHLLTNVDTPIQFDETIFPALSVLDLKKDEEKTSARKELFQSIDVRNSLNETIIVSDPADVVFSDDGRKAYALMAGSEDLVVFDLDRGGKAAQIVHRVPGDHPAGMALSPDGKTLFVHNTMSHDVSFVDTGRGAGDDGYAQARVNGDNVKLIGADPLPPEVRKGKTIFYSANSDKYPITNKNWMSCVSCHAGGETNGLTFTTAKGPRQTPSNVLAMETGLFMWDGSRDDFHDYILTVQGEMGGMLGVDPAKPLPADTDEVLSALEAFMKSPGAFPVPKSPYRNADGSMTVKAQQGLELFGGKAGCIACHAGAALTDSVRATGADGKLTTENTRQLYDVGTASASDVGAPGGDARAQFANPRDASHFDVPTLRGVWATAPYLHDGSAATLRDVVDPARGAGDKHGSTSKLTEEELDELVAYLQSIE
ncbi:beta-propeller fold lactonase family protein [Paenibacillus cymbidii]|nr:beta-propeller fold lactonase family protein [Paenibacillus cymbidii]